MIRLTLISSWAVLLVSLTACEQSGPVVDWRLGPKSCFNHGGSYYQHSRSLQMGETESCYFKNPESK